MASVVLDEQSLGLPRVLVMEIFRFALSTLGHLQVWLGSPTRSVGPQGRGAAYWPRCPDERSAPQRFAETGCSHRATLIVRKSGKGHSYYST